MRTAIPRVDEKLKVFGRRSGRKGVSRPEYSQVWFCHIPLITMAFDHGSSFLYRVLEREGER